MSILADDYRRDGYVTVSGLLASAEVESLRAEAAAIARGERGQIIGAEPAAGLDDDALMADILAIHFPHKISDLIRRTMSHPRIVEVLGSLIGPNVKSMQTMLFVKRAGKPGQAWHQDEHFIATRDRSLCGVWMALDDATVENGCLWMLPGSHRAGILYPTRDHGDARFDVTEEARDFGADRESGVPIEVKAGDVVFFDGYVLHRSLPNRAAGGFRRALVTHYMNAGSLLPWSFGGTLREDFRDIVMVSGDDPYAWRPIEDVLVPFVRPDDPDRVAGIYQAIDRQMSLRKAAQA